MTGKNFRIRTITAGINLKSADDFTQLNRTLAFLEQAKSSYEENGYEVQTLRIATQPVADYLPDFHNPAALESLLALDSFAVKNNLDFSIGPVLINDKQQTLLSSWAADLVKNTKKLSFSISVASEKHGIHYHSIKIAADTIAKVAHAVPGGEGNFRFTAAAFCPPGIPFFPAAYHDGADAFSIGLESPGIIQSAFNGLTGKVSAAKANLVKVMNLELAPVEKLAAKISQQSGRGYLGIDLSPAPGLGMEGSICHAIEMLSGSAFGGPATLSTCAAITDVFKELDIKSCGYSGLMLPVLEDSLLAKRAIEKRYSVSDLLLFSSVCGTGLDVVPLPGDIPVDALAGIIGDVAALAAKYKKPLSARLFPVPGKQEGEMVHFDNPYLTDSAVMKPE